VRFQPREEGKKLHLTSNPTHIIVWVEQRTLMAVAKKEIVRANDEKMLNNMMFFFPPKRFMNLLNSAFGELIFKSC
jgi:hypothetical protein